MRFVQRVGASRCQGLFRPHGRVAHPSSKRIGVPVYAKGAGCRLISPSAFCARASRSKAGGSCRGWPLPRQREPWTAAGSKEIMAAVPCGAPALPLLLRSVGNTSSSQKTLSAQYQESDKHNIEAFPLSSDIYQVRHVLLDSPHFRVMLPCNWGVPEGNLHNAGTALLSTVQPFQRGNHLAEL